MERENISIEYVEKENVEDKSVDFFSRKFREWKKNKENEEKKEIA